MIADSICCTCDCRLGDHDVMTLSSAFITAAQCPRVKAWRRFRVALHANWLQLARHTRAGDEYKFPRDGSVFARTSHTAGEGPAPSVRCHVLVTTRRLLQLVQAGTVPRVSATTWPRDFSVFDIDRKRRSALCNCVSRRFLCGKSKLRAPRPCLPRRPFLHERRG